MGLSGKSVDFTKVIAMIEEPNASKVPDGPLLLRVVVGSRSGLVVAAPKSVPFATPADD